jgi:hypothetical protein
VNINLLKALLPRKRTSKTTGPATEKEEGETEEQKAELAEVLDLWRRGINVVLTTRVIPRCLLDQILCTLSKVPGSNDLADSRPLTLISIVLNLAIGVQIDNCGDCGAWERSTTGKQVFRLG